MAVIYETVERRVCDEEDCEQGWAEPCSNCNSDFCSDHSARLMLNQFFDDRSRDIETMFYLCRNCFYVERNLDLLKLIEQAMKKQDWRMENWKKAVWKNDPYVRLTGLESEEGQD